LTVPLVGFGASRGFALLGGVAGAFLGCFGGFSAVLAGNAVTILVWPRLGLRSVVAVTARFAAGLVGGAARGGGRRRRGLARRQRDSANDFVGQLGIRIHDDLHRHVEIPLVLLGRRALRKRPQQKEAGGYDARAHDHWPALL
jgi:hypothetical protein